MLNNVKHIFFDLDKTLWDFETNSTQTLTELFEKYELKSKGITSIEEMNDIYKKINDKLWAAYAQNLITKEDLRTERFRKTFEYFGIFNHKLAFEFGLDYIELSPRKKTLFPNTIETLNYLNKKYSLHIITNGFEEVQYIKLKSCGIFHFFKEVITSERAGAKKPDKAIFEFALNKINSSAEFSLMIGDDLNIDIYGALNVNMRAVYFNPHTPPEKNSNEFISINSLSRLKELL